MLLKQLEIFLKRKWRQAFQGYFQKKDRKQLVNPNFVLISRNCWGGQVYKWLGMPYNTPFVGLFLFGPCYMKLLKDFDAYMAKELTFIETSKYPDAYNNHPIGLLGDVEIHFQHYESIEEAKDKWNRRKQRMLAVSKENYFFTICDRRGTTVKDILEFHTLGFKNKLSFSFSQINGLSPSQHITFFKNKKNQTPPNGKKRFKLSFLYLDLVHWLNQHKVIRTRFKA